VAAGYYLTLRRWSRGAVAATETENVVDVTTAVNGTNTVFAVPRAEVTVVSAGSKWQVAVPRSALYCSAALCGAGKFSLEAFGALSYYDADGAVADPFTAGEAVAQAGLPVANEFAYYGKPAGPGSTTVGQRVAAAPWGACSALHTA
jgi:hypothetical protein